MPLTNILGIKIHPFLFLFTELSSQFQIRPDPTPPPQSSRPPHPPQETRRRPSAILPQGLQLRRPDGTFYDLTLPAAPMTTPDQFDVGILDTNGVLRPFYYRGRRVKVRRHGPGNFEIVALTSQEYVEYGFDHNITPFHQGAAEFVAEERNRRRGGRSG